LLPLIVLSALFAGSVAVAAAAPPLILEHLTTADGLPQATVMTTLQDSQGFVWFGTEDGLVRYDGHELYRYAYSRTERGTLPGNFIWKVVEDSGNNLWMAIKDTGLARWDRRTDTFTSWRHDPSNLNSLASDGVRAILVDAQGLVWAGTSDAGIDIIDPASGRIEHLRHDASKPGSLASDRIFTFTLDRAGNVWVGTDAGLDRWQPAQRSFAHVGPLRNRQVSRVVEDQNGALWVGMFDGGLTRLDRQGRVLETFRHDPRRATSLSSDDVRAILTDQAGHVWVGTAEGLDLLDRLSGEFDHYRNDPADAESLRDSFVMSLYQDGSGLVWIGTRAGGVSRWNPRSWELGEHRPAWLGSGPVTAFADAPDNRVWIASLGGGVTQYDGDTGKAQPISAFVRDKGSLNDIRVMSMRQDRRGTLWIGTVESGLKKLTAEGRVETIPVKPGDPRSVSASGPMTIVESRSGQLWLGTFEGGLNILDPVTGLVTQLPYGANVPGAVSAPVVTAIAEDSRGNFWIGTDGGGLNLARADGTVLRVFKHDARDASSLPANTVYALAVDAAGRVWVGTDVGGLVRVVGSSTEPASIRFESLGRAQGLSSDTIYGVVPDARGAIWLSGNAGLMRFDPESGAVKTYHREHGLQGEEFAFGAYLRLRDGRLAFGGPVGFNIFDPAKLSENRQAPRLALTNVEVLGVRAAGATPFWLRDRIPLDYRGSIVSLDFGVLDFTSPKHNRLAYRMAGLTDRWIDLGTQRRITLTNLDAGDHTLEVRAANSDSVWSPEPLRLKIHRDPVPWKSTWAYAAYALAALGLIFYRVRKHRLKFREMVRARERLESEVQARTRELTESNRQLAEAAQAKSNFLDRMSHELRTPMNGVVGMTELLSRTPLSATQSHLTKTIRSSAQILLQIVNDLLDLSKIRAGKVALETLPIDLGQVLEECTSLFAGAAEAKGIELIVCPPARSEATLLGDPLRVRQILMNLVGNAVKFTAQGEVAVRADVLSVEGDIATVQLAVADTGIGMDAKAISKIFEPFAQADETTTRKFGGTGLGLAICRELADIMGGRITVESKPQIGSTFFLSLPLRVGPAVARNESAQLPAARVRIAARRTSLAESLARHASSLGLTVLTEQDAQREDILIVDVSSRGDLLDKQLAAGGVSEPVLVVVATAAEVEARSLRMLMREKLIVLKPVHRIALHEAFALALGVESATLSDVRGAQAGEPRLKGHVLLVEDEPVNAAVAEGYLEALGCTSVWAKNGTEAVARSAGERFDLVFMDLNMPGIDGFATAALIRERERAQNGARVPIVALTAHDAVNYREKVLKADMDDILSKPYALEDCTRLLRRWLARADAAATSGSAPRVAPARAASKESGSATSVGAAPPVAATSSTAAEHAAARTSLPALASVDASAVAALRRLRGGKQADLYSRLVELFRPASAEALASLQAALEGRDLVAAASICHKLASSAANVGALVYAKQIRQLEQACIAADIVKVRELNVTLQAAHAPLMEALQDLCLRESA
jgi:signal transduction histidine kinase/ligand-binding sensor domain-containing protein/CheY-like chemotaxis protein